MFTYRSFLLRGVCCAWMRSLPTSLEALQLVRVFQDDSKFSFLHYVILTDLSWRWQNLFQPIFSRVVGEPRLFTMQTFFQSCILTSLLFLAIGPVNLVCWQTLFQSVQTPECSYSFWPVWPVNLFCWQTLFQSVLTLWSSPILLYIYVVVESVLTELVPVCSVAEVVLVFGRFLW